EAAHDDALAATAQTNAARLALRRKDATQATALLTRAVDTLERLPPSYSRGMALVSAGSAVFEGEGGIPADAQAAASRALRTAAGPDRYGADQLSPGGRRAAVGAAGHPGGVSRRPLLLSGDLWSGLPRIQRHPVAPGIVRSGAGGAADQGSTRHGREAQG